MKSFAYHPTTTNAMFHSSRLHVFKSGGNSWLTRVLFAVTRKLQKLAPISHFLKKFISRQLDLNFKKK